MRDISDIISEDWSDEPLELAFMSILQGRHISFDSYPKYPTVAAFYSLETGELIEKSRSMINLSIESNGRSTIFIDMSVLEQKCKMLIRRSKGLTKEDIIDINGIRLNFSSREVEIKSGSKMKKVDIGGKDFLLLAYLMENENIVLSREQILAKVWGYGFEGEDRVVDTHIKNIRKALGEKGSLIETITGTGYKFKS